MNVYGSTDVFSYAHTTPVFFFVHVFGKMFRNNVVIIRVFSLGGTGDQFPL